MVHRYYHGSSSYTSLEVVNLASQQKSQSQSLRFQIANSKSQLSLQKNSRMKSRNVKSRIATFRNRKFQIVMFFCLWNGKDKSSVPKLSDNNKEPRGPNDQKKSISLEIFNLDRDFVISLENFNLDVSISPQKNRAAVGGSLENFILARNFQSHSKSQLFLIIGPSGKSLRFFGGRDFKSQRVRVFEIAAFSGC